MLKVGQLNAKFSQPEDIRKSWISADVFVAVAKLGGEVDKLDLSPGFVPGLDGGLVQSFAELEGDHSVIFGVEDENGAIYHSDPLFRHEGDVAVRQAGGEEPVKPGHLAPDPAHRVVPHLVVDIVEGRLQDEASWRTAL